MVKNQSKAKPLTERDRRLMHWIGTNGVASFKQLYTVFWTTATERTCQERLVQLEKADWLERHYVYTSRKRGEQVYTLTRRAATEHFEAATRRRLMIGLPATSELKQQLTAQDTRIVLEQILAAQGKQIVNWLNERELRSEAAFLQRKAGSRAWGGLADMADARIFIGPGPRPPDMLRQKLTGKRTLPEGCNTGNTALNTVSALNLALLSLPSPSSTFNRSTHSFEGPVQCLDIEIDGQYYGQMLKNKIAGIARGKQPTLWVTTANRAVRIESEIKQAGTASIWVMVVEPLL